MSGTVAPSRGNNCTFGRLSPPDWFTSYIDLNDFLTIYYLNPFSIQRNTPCKDNVHYGVNPVSGFVLLPSRYWRYAPFGDGPIMTIMYIIAKQINLFRTDSTYMSSLGNQQLFYNLQSVM